MNEFFFFCNAVINVTAVAVVKIVLHYSISQLATSYEKVRTNSLYQHFHTTDKNFLETCGNEPWLSFMHDGVYYRCSSYASEQYTP